MRNVILFFHTDAYIWVMRFLSVIILTCFIFLSMFAAMAKPMEKEKAHCCKKKTKMACHKKQVDDNKQSKNCSQPGCAMMFSCSLCGFIPTRGLNLQPLQARLLPKPVARYKSGNIAAYHPDNWKPPKAC